ncbi:2OG-Fe(II) oxygenase [Mucilaginibacter sp.]|uniref:2OG-Fe(II) oxygenase n=1 Tax=Mucilaginibacter sp. TaxID=1882438 RepID=UPI003D0A91F9
MDYLNKKIDLKRLATERKLEYQNAEPFSNIVFHDFFNPEMLDAVLAEFPDLSLTKNIEKFDDYNQKKLATKGEASFGEVTKLLVHYLNSEPFLEFIQELTGIKEKLISDPYFEGGGYHEIKPGGVLKVHTDFSTSLLTNLDRRINLLVYLNKDWEDSFGGHFELWRKDMSQCEKKILPVFNTVAIFSTIPLSNHGHPNPLTCPPDRSRKSLALYYYSNGRPQNEISNDTLTTFKGRKGVVADVKERSTREIIRDFIPPILLRAFKKTKTRTQL